MIPKLAVLTLGIFTLIGCATAEPIQGPDGGQNELIQCSFGIASCYQKASEVCHGPYKIVNTSSDVSSDGLGGTSTTNQLLVKCGR